jgi:serine/threonine-protein kinase
MMSAALQHPHIVPVLSAGELDGIPYFVMPFIEGESLRMRLVRGPLSVRETVTIMRDVARALAFAHRAGVVHRDIKPDNILLAQGSAVVTDFGVAKALVDARTPSPTSGGSNTNITAVGVSLGTPQYMAPEQATADPNTDHRADIYAFGVVAYEMLAGTPPFHGRRTAELLRAHLTETPRQLSTVRGDIPVALERLVMRALEKDPDHRFQTATQLVSELDSPSAVSGEVAALTANGGRRSMWRYVVAALVLAAIVVGVVVSKRGKGAAAVSTAGVIVEVVPFQSRTTGSDSTLTRDVFADLVGALRATPGVQVREVAFASATPDSQRGPRVLTLRGTLQQSAGRIRSNVRLSESGSDSTLWSGRFEGTVADVLGFEDRLAKATLAGLSAARK